MSTSHEEEKGREAIRQKSWSAAYAALSAVRETLTAADLCHLATACYLLGRDDEYVSVTQDAHQAYLDAGDPRAAARCAFWLGFYFSNRGEMALATGWFGRAARLLEDQASDTPERGYLLLPIGFQQLMAGRPEATLDTAAQALTFAQHGGDADLLALALHLQGRALLRLTRVEEGLALLDEAMVGVALGRVSPPVSGVVYCSVIGACREVWALRRAHEWTSALHEWCRQQPDMVAYAGECRVYRAEILQLHGEWLDALAEARRAAELSARSSRGSAAGLAHYQRAEVHRLQGELDLAEEAYRAASLAGREPQPGLALLRLARGDQATAAVSIRRALTETADRLQRVRLLPAHIEIMLEGGEVEEARRSCDELEEIAQSCARDILGTVVAQARGALRLAAGEAEQALAPLRRACREWQELPAPYQAARARVLVALACRELGDQEGADLELGAARAEFERLGAGPDAARVAALTRRASVPGKHGLTARELEVLSLLATGRTNRGIASALSISEKTVARHVANIFGKLGLSTRAAATAYAYQNGLVDRPA
jgi:ATP/maltotriose-dependent transcriptional regulator MalT